MLPLAEKLVRRRPWLFLTTVYIAWKLIILLIGCISPGIGYDTSSSLLETFSLESSGSQTPNSLRSIWSKFVRWDAIYFATLSFRGRVWEQELAFSPGIADVCSAIVQAGRSNVTSIFLHVQTAMFLSFITHWLSMLALFELTRLLIDPKTGLSRSIPVVAASLHVISPAGIFLVAPYAESTFSCLNMFGFLTYTKAKAAAPRDAVLWTLAAGIAFGSATFIRSNGILSGIPFLLDAAEPFWSIVVGGNKTPRRRAISSVTFLATISAGCCVGLGLIIPQAYAYQEYCTGAIEVQPWCQHKIPLAYSYVQSYYWNVGFLKYWTLSNVPLFLLAIPVLWLLGYSGWTGISTSATAAIPLSDTGKTVASRLAIPQLVLAILALTNYHVQIITRLSSGYPLWYVWLAAKMGDLKLSQIVIRFMVIYGLVQAGLFASFLPPA